MEKIISLTKTEFDSVSSSGTSLRTTKARELQHGVYAIVEISNVELRSREEVIEALTSYFGEQPKWADNLPDSNISGICRLKIDGKLLAVYLNNPLFNLMIEQGALRNNKGEISLTGSTFKV